MVDVAKNPSESLSPVEVKKRRALAMVPFDISREMFSNWFHASVSHDMDWTNPMIGQMFQAWVAGSGIKEWITDKEIAAREKRNKATAETRAKMAKLREEAEKKGNR